ncbi:MAG: ABC transporter ATP-binding protein [Polyangiaceae bacterium]|nr:ABC transporter ATP-binding protein [Polyangiaceae bacterium]
MSAAPKPKNGEKSRGEAALARFHEEGGLTSYDSKNLLRLWPYIRPHRAYLLGSVALLLLASGFALARPLIMRSGLDGIGKEPGAITRAGLLLTAVIIIEQGIAFPQMYLMQAGGAKAMNDLRLAVFRFLHTRSLAFFDRTPVGRLVTRVTNDVDAIGEMFASGALNAIGDLVRLAVIVGVLLWMNWKMSLIAFVLVPPILLVVNWTRRRIREAFREVRTKTARMNAYVNEQVNGMALVQAYAREDAGAKEFDVINSAYRDANNRSIVLDATMDASIEMISSLCIASVLWAAGVQSASEHVTFGTLFAFVAYIEMFFLPIRDLSARYTLVQSAMTGAERVFELFDNQDEDAPPRTSSSVVPKTSTADETGPALELDGVSFGYKPGVLALRDVTLQIARGEKVALVGATGAGKSTVASLFLRLYEVEEGTVRAFGRDVRDYPRDELRTRFAVVPQDVFLFPGTVATNIAAGDVKPDMPRVKQALERVGALDIFERREGGLDAKVGERGSNFSAGERQLIAFARALYKDPDVLVLDEATASIDSDTESRLQHAVEEILVGRTSLVIAHRLSTIRAADRIVVFHKGRVVEEGRHEALLAKGGVYARLHALQFAKEAEARSARPAAIAEAAAAASGGD